jgi:vacuolar-type H+-ATPase subunit H
VSEKNRRLKRSSLENSTSERLEAIVEAAERAAAKVIDDAEAEARRHVSDAEAEAASILGDQVSALAELTDSLIEQAEGVCTESERLLAALEEARGKLGAVEGGAAVPRLESVPGEPEMRGNHLSAVEDPVEENGRPGAAGARLLATQMAVSGSSREEIASRLRNGFQIEDTDSILDAILGPED